MSDEKLPKWYESLERKHPKFINAVQELGKVVRQEGPLDEKTTFNPFVDDYTSLNSAARNSAPILLSSRLKSSINRFKTNSC